jgi:hypothetical protein
MDEFQQMGAVCEQLFRDAGAQVLFLTDKNGVLFYSIGLATDELALSESVTAMRAGESGTKLSETEHLLPIGAGRLYVVNVIDKAVLSVSFEDPGAIERVRTAGKMAAAAIGSILEALAARQLGRSRGS